MKGIIVDRVELRIKGTSILEDVSASFKEGMISGIVGRNGSGKSMLFKCICGFITPTAGQITINGQDYHKQGKFPDSVGFIIEAPGFLPDCSAYENLLRLASINGRVKPDQIEKWISLVGLDPSSRKKVGKFSLGMKQRLGIAQAIMEDPEILILDEPFNGLDKDGVEDIRKLLAEYKHQGKTILLSSHNPLDISTLCDTVYEMDKGHLALAESSNGLEGK